MARGPEIGEAHLSLHATLEQFDRELAEARAHAQQFGTQGKKSFDEVEFAARQFGVRFNTSMDGSRRAATAFSHNVRGSLQNTAFQVADIAVQMEAGVPVARVFAQQGSQILAAWGPLGAVFGAGIAVLGGLAGAMFNMGRDTDEVTEMLEELADVQDRVNRIVAAGQVDVDDLAEKYEGLAGATREYIEALQEQAIIEATRSIREQAEGVRNLIDEMRDVRRVAEEIQQTPTAFGAFPSVERFPAQMIPDIEEAAREFEERMASIGRITSENAGEAAEAVETFAARLTNLANTEAMPPERLEDLVTFRDRLQSTAEQLRATVGELQTAEGSVEALGQAAEDAGPNLGRISAALEQLAGERLSAQIDGLRELREQLKDMADDAGPEAKEQIEVLEEALDKFEEKVERARERVEAFNIDVRRLAGRGIEFEAGTSARATPEDFQTVLEERRERERQIEQEQKEAQRELEQNFRDIERAAATVGAAIAGWALDEASFQDAARSIVRNLISMAIQAALAAAALAAVQAVIGDVGAGARGASAAAAVAQGVAAVVAGGGRTSFQHGGIVEGRRRFAFSGGVGEMGEAGREAIIPMGASALQEVGRAIGDQMSGGGRGTVNISVDARGSTPGMEQKIEEAVARAVRISREQTVSDLRRRPGVRRNAGL